jgi:hypothetical protein
MPCTRTHTHIHACTQVAQRQDSEALESTITRIKAGLDARGVQYEDISGRPKNLYGIWQKMQSSGKSTLDQVRVCMCVCAVVYGVLCEFGHARKYLHVGVYGASARGCSAGTRG